MTTTIALEILYVDILDTGSYNETGTVNTWGLSGIWFSLAAIQINLLSQCKIGSFSSINYKRSSKSSNFRIRNAPNPGFIVGQLHKKLGNPAAKTSKRLDSLFLYPGFMFHVSIAVMKSSENIKKTWSIILFFKNSCFKLVLLSSKNVGRQWWKPPKRSDTSFFFFGNSGFKQVLR